MTEKENSDSKIKFFQSNRKKKEKKIFSEYHKNSHHKRKTLATPKIFITIEILANKMYSVDTTKKRFWLEEKSDAQNGFVLKAIS